ncbi:hypothetical protein PILCRDRAFT_661852 [Piloderma croceum F 1598]|uniref:Uncharacterized protein n=1 Tax=Piloderma croceum (strain F 1598) TaxID=765440 RepID=A0A0C3F7Z0_PILCF|nr:hypothetical protein PILCRDRAFT_661852 [Piloderma croceum F 1598]
MSLTSLIFTTKTFEGLSLLIPAADTLQISIAIYLRYSVVTTCRDRWKQPGNLAQSNYSGFTQAANILHIDPEVARTTTSDPKAQKECRLNTMATCIPCIDLLTVATQQEIGFVVTP